MTAAVLAVEQVRKGFVLHAQGGAAIPVLDGLSFSVAAGECVALTGPSGAGKSTVLRMIYGNYRIAGGDIRVLHGGAPVALAAASPRRVVEIRRRTIGYVSQFLRVIPRVAATDIVAAPLLALGTPPAEAGRRAETLMARLNLPRRLWRLSPATFSGGEQQRVNVAVGLIAPRPLLLLDEPTAALDARNRAVVMELIREAVARGAAVLGIFHDPGIRAAVADRCVDLAPRTQESPR